MKVKKTFRIDEDVYAELLKLCNENNVTQGEAVELAIRGAGKVLAGCHTPASTPGDPSAVAALAAQLAVKDEQIAALGRALESAQETARAAQALQAMGASQAMVGLQGRRRGILLRLRDALVGDGPSQ